MSDERNNCLSYWFPRLEDAGVPVPVTKIIRCENPLELLKIIDGVQTSTMNALVNCIAAATKLVGLPAFLRTGQGSGKHNWDRCCHLISADHSVILKHVAALVEWSECADFLGMPYDVWAVREWLPGPVAFVNREWSNMPVRREFRCFVDGEKVECVHPYWPIGAFRNGLEPEERSALESINTLGANEAAVKGLASRAGAALGGRWSVDVLWTDRGWYVTDCAIAERSFHWPDCPIDKG